MPEYDYYILFHNHTDGLMLEKLLKQNEIKHVIVPTPRQLSKCCGIAIKYSFEDDEKIKQIVKAHEAKVMGFHSLEKKRYEVKFI